MRKPPSSNLDQHHLTKKTVVLVEDDPVFRDFFSGVLKRTDDLKLLGVAHDLESGLAFLEMEIPDVLLVDLGLPDGTGLDLIEKARKRWGDKCHIMVISVFGDDNSVIQSFEHGAEGYLLKNSSARDFAQDIRDLIAGGSPISPIIAKKILHRFKQNEVEKTKSPHILLTPRERETLQFLAMGMSKKETANAMHIGLETVKENTRRIFRKMYDDCVNDDSEPKSRRKITEVINDARRWGLI